MTLLLPMALAAEWQHPSARPEAPPPAECVEAAAVAGRALVPACDGVFVPAARMVWLADMVAWADEAEAMRKLNIAQAEAAIIERERALAEQEARSAYWQDVAKRPTIEPVAGAVGGLALGVVLAVATEVAVLGAAR